MKEGAFPPDNVQELQKGIFDSSATTEHLEYSYQTPQEFAAGITSTEVKPGEPGYKEAETITVPALQGQDIGFVESGKLNQAQKNYLNEHIQGTNEVALASGRWWLEEEWQKLLKEGKLCEQIRISHNDKAIEIFNFQKPFNEKDVYYKRKLDQICQGVKRLFELFGDKAALICPAILLKPGKTVTDALGREDDPAGYAESSIKSIILTENGTHDVFTDKHIYHEFGHLLEHDSVGSFTRSHRPGCGQNVKDWLEIGGWTNGIENGWHASKEVPTEYAGTRPEEDFAVSFARFAHDPEELDEERREFFLKYYFKGATADKPTDVKIEKLTGKDIRLPRAKPFERKYKIKLYDSLEKL